MRGKREIKKNKRKFNLEMFLFEHLDFVFLFIAILLTFAFCFLIRVFEYHGVPRASVTESEAADYSVNVVEIPLLEVQECAFNLLEVENTVYESEETIQEVAIISYDEEVIDVLCKVVYGEARGCDKTQQAAVVWCILNRMDSDKFPNDIVSVVTQKNQFEGYSSKFPVTDEIKWLVLDVLGRYEQEKAGIDNVGRVLPNDYLFFRSSGKGTNLFRQNYKSKTIWDWSWGTPYGEE